MMRDAAPQIPLMIPQRPKYRLDTFLGAANRELVSRLAGLAEEEVFACLWLQGARGSGKTHLLQAACAAAGDLPVAYLAPPANPERVGGLEGVALLAIDDVETWAGSDEAERALMALYEGLGSHGAKLVVASALAPSAVSWRRPDLASRFKAASLHVISEPEESDKRRLVGQLARSRGLEIPGVVVEYLMTHGRRGVGDLLAAVDTLDRATLAERRRVTVPFAKRVLGLR